MLDQPSEPQLTEWLSSQDEIRSTRVVLPATAIENNRMVLTDHTPFVHFLAIEFCPAHRRRLHNQHASRFPNLYFVFKFAAQHVEERMQQQSDAVMLHAEGSPKVMELFYKVIQDAITEWQHRVQVV